MRGAVEGGRCGEPGRGRVCSGVVREKGRGVDGGRTCVRGEESWVGEKYRKSQSESLGGAVGLICADRWGVRGEERGKD